MKLGCLSYLLRHRLSHTVCMVFGGLRNCVATSADGLSFVALVVFLLSSARLGSVPYVGVGSASLPLDYAIRSDLLTSSRNSAL